MTIRYVFCFVYVSCFNLCVLCYLLLVVLPVFVSFFPPLWLPWFVSTVSCFPVYCIWALLHSAVFARLPLLHCVPAVFALLTSILTSFVLFWPPVLPVPCLSNLHDSVLYFDHCCLFCGLLLLPPITLWMWVLTYQPPHKITLVFNTWMKILSSQWLTSGAHGHHQILSFLPREVFPGLCFSHLQLLVVCGSFCHQFCLQ